MAERHELMGVYSDDDLDATRLRTGQACGSGERRSIESRHATLDANLEDSLALPVRRTR